MQRNIIFIMSLSGTIVYFLYVLLYPIAKKYFAIKWRYLILKIALIFYLVPLPFFKYEINNFFMSIFPSGIIKKHLIPQYFDSSNLLYINDNAIIMYEGIYLIWLIAGFMGLLTFIIISFQIYKYLSIKRQCMLHCTVQASAAQVAQMVRLKEEIGLKRNVSMKLSEYAITPFVIGVFHPTIVLPFTDRMPESENKWDYILKHELIHIKNRDLLYKFIGLLVMAVHWYNPICYLVFRELCNIEEMNCDRNVLKGKNDEQREIYSYLILSMATENKTYIKNFPSVGLISFDVKMMKRRVLEMKIKEKNKRGLAVLISMGICILASIPVFAYETPVRIENLPIMESDEFMEGTIIPGPRLEVVQEYLPYDSFYTDKEGRMFEGQDNKPEEKSCKHSYQPGEYTKHVAKSNGSCIMSYYNAQICEICGQTKILDKYQENNYAVCPH